MRNKIIKEYKASYAVRLDRELKRRLRALKRDRLLSI